MEVTRGEATSDEVAGDGVPSDVPNGVPNDEAAAGEAAADVSANGGTVSPMEDDQPQGTPPLLIQAQSGHSHLGEQSSGFELALGEQSSGFELALGEQSSGFELALGEQRSPAAPSMRLYEPPGLTEEGSELLEHSASFPCGFARLPGGEPSPEPPAAIDQGPDGRAGDGREGTPDEGGEGRSATQAAVTTSRAPWLDGGCAWSLRSQNGDGHCRGRVEPQIRFPFDEPNTCEYIVFASHEGSGEHPPVLRATLTKLVERLTHPAVPGIRSGVSAEHFLLTYRSFTTPMMLMRLLCARFHVPRPHNVSQSELRLYFRQVVVPIRLGVVKVLKLWLRTYPNELAADARLCEACSEFANQLREIPGLLSHESRRLSELLSRVTANGWERARVAVRGRLQGTQPETPPTLTAGHTHSASVGPPTLTAGAGVMPPLAFPTPPVGRPGAARHPSGIAPPSAAAPVPVVTLVAPVPPPPAYCAVSTDSMPVDRHGTDDGDSDASLHAWLAETLHCPMPSLSRTVPSGGSVASTSDADGGGNGNCGGASASTAAEEATLATSSRFVRDRSRTAPDALACGPASGNGDDDHEHCDSSPAAGQDTTSSRWSVRSRAWSEEGPDTSSAAALGAGVDVNGRGQLADASALSEANVRIHLPSLGDASKLLELAAKDVAQHLAFDDSQHFRAVSPHEFLRKAWATPSRRHLARNILAATARFNAISAWVQYEILFGCTVGVTPSAVRERAKVYVRFIEIAWECFQLKAFAPAVAIIAATTTQSVYRLETTYSEVKKLAPRDLDAHWKTMKQKLSVENNCYEMRETFKNTSPPCVPYLGMYCTELNKLEESAEDEFMQAGAHLPPLINFGKRRKIAEVIQRVQTLQNPGYPQSFGLHHAVMQYLEKDCMRWETALYQGLLANDSTYQKRLEAAFYRQSQRCEPRRGTTQALNTTRRGSLDVVTPRFMAPKSPRRGSLP